MLQASGLLITFTPQKNSFGFLVMMYDKVGDGDRFSYKKFGLGRSRFYATVTQKLKLKNFAYKI